MAYHSYVLFLFIILLIKTNAKSCKDAAVFRTIIEGNYTAFEQYNCHNHHQKLNLRSIIGTWYVVAIIPDIEFPEDHNEILCYRVEFSETDVAGLRWLVNKSCTARPPKESLEKIRGTILRQRYHVVPPFDVWSMSVDENIVTGCFTQVLTKAPDKQDINQMTFAGGPMWLRYTDDLEPATPPYLLQVLWGKYISAVIYRKEPHVSEADLLDLTHVVSTIKGPQKRPIACKKSLQEVLGEDDEDYYYDPGTCIIPNGEEHHYPDFL